MLLCPCSYVLFACLKWIMLTRKYVTPASRFHPDGQLIYVIRMLFPAELAVYMARPDV